MAKLHFYYSVMNAGKSTALLQAAHNYESKGWTVLYFTSSLDNRSGVGYISSRVGIKREAVALSSEDSFLPHVQSVHGVESLVIFVDECQFFTQEQIVELVNICDKYGVPVLCYGLKNNSNGDLFGPAIHELLAKADQIKELKTICHCGSKATQILRYNAEGAAVLSSAIVEVGAEDRYESVCRYHFNEAHNLI